MGHGHWNLFYRSPATSPFRWTRPLRWLPPGVREWRGTRRGIKEIAKWLSGYSGYFAIYNVPVDRLAYYDICETTDIYQPGGLAPSRSIFDIFTAQGCLMNAIPTIVIPTRKSCRSCRNVLSVTLSASTSCTFTARCLPALSCAMMRHGVVNELRFTRSDCDTFFLRLKSGGESTAD